MIGLSYIPLRFDSSQIDCKQELNESFIEIFNNKLRERFKNSVNCATYLMNLNEQYVINLLLGFNDCSHCNRLGSS